MQHQKAVLIQEQKLKMSPQMFQSIQLMALPIQDLKIRIQEEIDKNPALELIEDRSEVSLEGGTKSESEDYDAFENSSDPGYTHTTSGAVNQEAADARQKFMEGVISRAESLQEHLLWQLSLQPLDEPSLALGRLLIQNLDKNGFHTEPPESFVKNELKPLIPAVEAIIRAFEPVGTCVNDYRESLLVQWELDPLGLDGVDTLLEKHMADLEKGRLKEISKATKFTLEEIEELLEYIRTLNPYPGTAYSQEEVRYVIPDLMLRIEEGEFVLYLNDEEIPVLGINEYYKEILAEGDSESRKFVSSQVKDARWFIQSIEQRNSSLMKIAQMIVEFQRDFFIKGPKYLVPLTLKDVAAEVSVHETTVSRISNAKYIQTEWGIYPLKHFFSNSISGSGSTGSRFSKEGVKERVREILESNDTGKKLSDQKISDMLKVQGINLARRTVTKYRKELDIDSSYGR
ncbi:MAG: RNA polymerase factor sigma-54 [Spirochaetales bacterium]|nr:RNA polymerase factor sigma-54 [Spirochaetales bacterium]